MSETGAAGVLVTDARTDDAMPGSWREAQAETGEGGVTARTLPSHLWKPGQSGNPSGRPKSAALYKKALIERFSPEELADYWYEALQAARKAGDAVAMDRILNHLTEQFVGKPIATNVSVGRKYEELLLLRMAAGEEGTLIEGEVAQNE